MTPQAISPLAGPDSEAFQQHLCESMGVALIAINPDLTIRLWNAAAAALFGAGAERMIGTPVTSVIPLERRQAIERILKSVLRTGDVLDFEFQLRDVHGERRELITSVAPIISEPGVRIGVSLCIRDITRRIALQNELNESRKMSSLSAMAGAIAHHFHNILGGIMTGVDYARGSGDPAVAAKVLDQTGRSLARATVLVNGLLAFSEGGQCCDDLADLTEIITGIADEIERNNLDGRITFVLNLPVLPILPVARMQVQTILHNLVQNAIEAMPEGGTLRIDVSLDEERVVIAVTDTGCGLDEAARGRIFEPFWSTKQQPGAGGAKVKGLGLAITYGLVQILGGSISFTSEPQKGSCFKVSLPRPNANL